MAQDEIKRDSVNDNVTTLLSELTDKRNEINELNDSINKLNESINTTIRLGSEESLKQNDRISALQDTINQLRGENLRLVEEIRVKQDSLKIFATLDNIIYKECLLYPLERRYNPKYIEDAKHCLAAMNVERTHPKEHHTYYHFLDEYAAFNQEVLSFLKEQENGLSMKHWKINEIAISQADAGFKRLRYSRYYQNRNKSPWESILYLDETIERFFTLLKNGKLNAEAMQELIKRLEPKQQ